MSFKPDQHLDVVFSGETWNPTIPVVPDAATEIARDTYVERSMALASEDVNGRKFVHLDTTPQPSSRRKPGPIEAIPLAVRYLK